MTAIVALARSAKSGLWTEDALRLFLPGPDRFAAGINMPRVSLSPEQIGQIVETLKQLKVLRMLID